MLKVEDGLGNFCTYCIIPFTRGPVRSESIDAAVTQAKALAEAGYHEIVLTGIEISSWGDKIWKGMSPSSRRKLSARPSPPGAAGSLEPRTITEDFCRRASALPQPLPPLPSVPPVGQQCHLETDGGAIFGRAAVCCVGKSPACHHRLT